MLLLKIDLIGIGFKITGLASTLIYTGFHNYKDLGHPLSMIIFVMMTTNLLLQLTPCYMHDQYARLRLLFYVILISALFIIAIAWVFFIASEVELDLFFIRIMLSFLYIGMGFVFYSTGWPEKFTNNYWI